MIKAIIHNAVVKIILGVIVDLIEILPEPNELGKSYFVVNKANLAYYLSEYKVPAGSDLATFFKREGLTKFWEGKK